MEPEAGPGQAPGRQGGCLSTAQLPGSDGLSSVPGLWSAGHRPGNAPRASARSLLRRHLVKALNTEPCNTPGLPTFRFCLCSSGHLPGCPVLWPLTHVPSLAGTSLGALPPPARELCQARRREALPPCPLQLAMLRGCAHHCIPAWPCRPRGRAHGARMYLGSPRPTVPRARGLAWLQRPAAEPGRMASVERSGTSPGSLPANVQWPVTQVCDPRMCVNSLETLSPRTQAPRRSRGHASLWIDTSAQVTSTGPPSIYQTLSPRSCALPRGLPWLLMRRCPQSPSHPGTMRHLLHRPRRPPVTSGPRCPLPACPPAPPGSASLRLAPEEGSFC